jgi:hypothetical protein
MEALTIFNERVASPKEVADEIGVSLNKAGHHIKELLDADCVELVRTEPRGGSVEHFYRGIRRPELSDEEWRATPEESQRRIVATVVRNLIAETLSAIRSGKMVADRFLRLSWKSVSLDAQAREEVADEQRESLERLRRIEVDSAQRMIESGEEGVSTVVAVLGFTRSRKVQSSDDSGVPGEL